MPDTIAHDPADALVLREDRGGVAHVMLNRADQFNALSMAMLEHLAEVLTSIARTPSIRVVVIGARGKAFCPGHDLKEMQAQRTQAFVETLFRRCCEVMLSLARMPQPVIARVHGLATAAGCQLVAACDLAVASSQARFATSGIDYGLFCATPAVPLSRTLGRKHALQMLLTGEFIDAQTALRWGLVNEVVAPADLDSAIDALCATLLTKPPLALSDGKRFFYRQSSMAMEEAYRAAAELLTRQVLSAEAEEGLQAFLDKRLPRWP
jgi:enoyl-CoA hydratase/carnithine racemase